MSEPAAGSLTLRAEDSGPHRCLRLGMGGRSGGVEGADHPGAAESVVHGSSLSSDWASGPEVSARLDPALCPW